MPQEFATFQDAADHAGECAMEWIDAQLAALEAAEEADDPGHAREEAEREIHETPLSVEVRSDWHTPGGTATLAEYRILLSWGGPASQITGELDENGEPENARFEFQDWGKPWTEARSLNPLQLSRLRQWASQFYFAE